MGTVLRFPALYRIAWTDGEREGLINGYEFKNKRNAEAMRRLLQGYYPGLLLWVHAIRDDPQSPPPVMPRAA